MAIYQPSNVIPSTFAGLNEQTIDASENISISWQVNGNSPMTAFRLQIYNNATNVEVKDTGEITLDTPFFGVDNKGNPKQFIYAPSNTLWSSWGVENGNEYKMVITQFWVENTVSQSIIQWSGSVFLARAVPTLTLTYNNSDFNGETPIEYATATFGAKYSQAQGDNINAVRWQLAEVINGQRIIKDDTGFINTSILSYNYNGFFSDKTYAIKCTVETMNGQEATSGWINFAVSYKNALPSGDIRATCTNDGAVLLEWNPALNIPATFSPSDETPDISDSKLTLKSGQTVKWDTVNDAPMNFNAPFTFGIKTQLPENFTKTELSQFSTNDLYYVLSPSKKYLVAATFTNTSAISTIQVYNINNNFSLDKTFFITPLGQFYYTKIAFSSDEKFLFVFLTQNASTQEQLYKSDISNNGFSDLAQIDVPYMGTQQRYPFNDMIVSPTDNIMVLISYYYKVCNIYQWDENGELTVKYDKSGYSFAFSNDGKFLYSSINSVIAAGISATTFSAYSIDLTSTDFVKFFGSATVNSGLVNIMPLNGKNVAVLNANQISFLQVYNNGTTNVVEVKNGLSFSIDNNYNGLSFSLNDNCDTLLLYRYENGSTSNNCIFEIYAVDYINYTFIKQDENDDFALKYTVEETLPHNSWGNLFFDDNTIILPQNNNQISLVAKDLKNNIEINNIQFFKFNLPWQWFNTNSTAKIYSLDSVGLFMINGAQEEIVDYPTQISSIKLLGNQIVDWVYIANEIIDLTNIDIKWQNNTLFLADFKNDNLQAGTLSESGDVRNTIYRIEDQNDLQKVIDLKTTILKLKDFTLKSNNSYVYELFYAGDETGYSNPTISQEICKQLNFYMLIEATQYDNEIEEYPNVYHVVNVWRFGNNISAGSISNNNSPNWLTNFTPYRLRQPSQRLGQSGTLQALLSNYNQSENFYEDTVAMADKIKNASISTNTFFLKDMKGNLYMVGISGPITQTINTKSKVQEITVSVPWEEVGDASNVSLIQTPEDISWGND